jgi:uncharacterized membrane protein YedE/YeeE
MMPAWLTAPWPWYVAGPLIGLMVPLLLLTGNRTFGVSSCMRHLCAATVPGTIRHFRYDWKSTGLWNLIFLAGIFLGGVVGGRVLGGSGESLAPATRADLAALGIHDLSGIVPREILSWSSLMTASGCTLLVGGGFLVGFGSAYAGGCTSGHAISGLADLQLPSLLAVMSFFAGGLLATHFLLPALLK